MSEIDTQKCQCNFSLNPTLKNLLSKGFSSKFPFSTKVPVASTCVHFNPAPFNSFLRLKVLDFPPISRTLKMADFPSCTGIALTGNTFSPLPEMNDFCQTFSSFPFVQLICFLTMSNFENANCNYCIENTVKNPVFANPHAVFVYTSD